VIDLLVTDMLVWVKVAVLVFVIVLVV
jgi:hypothetical protein